MQIKAPHHDYDDAAHTSISTSFELNIAEAARALPHLLQRLDHLFHLNFNPHIFNN